MKDKHMDFKLKGFKYRISKEGWLYIKKCSLTHNRIVSNCGSDTWVLHETAINMNLLNPKKAYNIYAVCSKEYNSGQWVLEGDYLKDLSKTHYKFKIGVFYYGEDGLRHVEFSANISPFTATDSIYYTEEDDNSVVDWWREDKERKREEPEKSQYIFTDWEKRVQNDITAFRSLTKTNPHPHYNNEHGSLYKIAEQLGLNAYEFDILKRIARCRKKGQFEQDLQKIKDTVDLYLKEHKQ